PPQSTLMIIIFNKQPACYDVVKIKTICVRKFHIFSGKYPSIQTECEFCAAVEIGCGLWAVGRYFKSEERKIPGWRFYDSQEISIMTERAVHRAVKRRSKLPA
ncbi:hypothetical protein, partial [Erwinia mallotivora]|uniref:hypothetical protein n=1 Tax=Erwinia mallotivora TaxID=69222 RepID=UPI001F36B433